MTPDAKPISSSAQPEPATLDIAEALDAMDAAEMACMPLNDEFDEDEFHECTTWESDEEGHIIPTAPL